MTIPQSHLKDTYTAQQKLEVYSALHKYADERLQKAYDTAQNTHQRLHGPLRHSGTMSVFKSAFGMHVGNPYNHTLSGKTRDMFSDFFATEHVPTENIDSLDLITRLYLDAREQTHRSLPELVRDENMTAGVFFFTYGSVAQYNEHEMTRFKTMGNYVTKIDQLNKMPGSILLSVGKFIPKRSTFSRTLATVRDTIDDTLMELKSFGPRFIKEYVNSESVLSGTYLAIMEQQWAKKE